MVTHNSVPIMSFHQRRQRPYFVYIFMFEKSNGRYIVDSFFLTNLTSADLNRSASKMQFGKVIIKIHFLLAFVSLFNILLQSKPSNCSILSRNRG